MIFLLIQLWMQASGAQTASPEFARLERITVFPISTQKDYRGVATDAWWAMREELTRNKRFLIASESFLKRKEVYQPRTTLKPADAIILGRLLDAQALVCTALEGSELTMSVYDGENGGLLWTKSLQLQTSIPLGDQLKPASLKLIHDFLVSIPYQGHVVKDATSGLIVREKESMRVVGVQVGLGSGIQVGDDVEFVRLTQQNFEPLFQTGGKFEVIANGRVLQIDNESLEVEITKNNDKKNIKDEMLVRFPQEFRRIRELSEGQKLDAQNTWGQRNRPEPSHEKDGSLWNTLTFILGLAVFLVVAL